MKIATWNLQRLDKNKNQIIIDKLVDLDADILVLTETNSVIQLENYICVSTAQLPNYFDEIKYKDGENRVSIWTKYKTTNIHKTFDDYTTVCTDIETPFGVLTVYGTIIGVFANRQPRFDNDLYGQIADFEKIFPNKHVCIVGDFNVAFSGRAYPSHKARQRLIETFKKLELTNITELISDNVDHIVLSNEFLIGKQFDIKTWNIDKKLSDHVGHCITLT
nr:endonuclease/exonuclease/phosphatase family protein [uncultured Flavobacterium sp.]